MSAARSLAHPLVDSPVFAHAPFGGYFGVPIRVEAVLRDPRLSGARGRPE